MSQGLWRPSRSITPNQPIEQIYTAMQAMTLAIKNVTDAKLHLLTNSWALPGEEITLETLPRTLFSVVANNPKITPALIPHLRFSSHRLNPDRPSQSL